MKQMIFLTGLVASLFVVGCATKSNNEVVSQPMQEQPATVHHDLKGETGSEKY